MYDERTFAGKTLVAELGAWDYDWSVMGLFSDEAGRLYVATDRGCSCNSPWEYPGDIDFTPVASIHEALAKGREFVDEDYLATQTDYAAFEKEVLAL